MRSFDVAVVIVTYRTADLTIACLRSLQRERQASLNPPRPRAIGARPSRR